MRVYLSIRYIRVWVWIDGWTVNRKKRTKSIWRFTASAQLGVRAVFCLLSAVFFGLLTSFTILESFIPHPPMALSSLHLNGKNSTTFPFFISTLSLRSLPLFSLSTSSLWKHEKVQRTEFNHRTYSIRRSFFILCFFRPFFLRYDERERAKEKIKRRKRKNSTEHVWHDSNSSRLLLFYYPRHPRVLESLELFLPFSMYFEFFLLLYAWVCHIYFFCQWFHFVLFIFFLLFFCVFFVSWLARRQRRWLR